MNYGIFLALGIAVLFIGLLILAILTKLSQKIKNKRFSKFLERLESFFESIDPLQMG